MPSEEDVREELEEERSPSPTARTVLLSDMSPLFFNAGQDHRLLYNLLSPFGEIEHLSTATHRLTVTPVQPVNGPDFNQFDWHDRPWDRIHTVTVTYVQSHSAIDARDHLNSTEIGGNYVGATLIDGPLVHTYGPQNLLASTNTWDSRTQPDTALQLDGEGEGVNTATEPPNGPEQTDLDSLPTAVVGDPTAIFPIPTYLSAPIIPEDPAVQHLENQIHSIAQAVFDRVAHTTLQAAARVPRSARYARMGFEAGEMNDEEDDGDGDDGWNVAGPSQAAGADGPSPSTSTARYPHTMIRRGRATFITLPGPRLPRITIPPRDSVHPHERVTSGPGAYPADFL